MSKFLSKLGCFFGFHDWRLSNYVWVSAKTVDAEGMIEYTYTCKRCGREKKHDV